MDPTVSGKVVVEAKISPAGEVTATQIVSKSGLDTFVSLCAVSVVKTAHFTSPGGSGSTVAVPLTFTPPQR
jgi:TonB family protein